MKASELELKTRLDILRQSDVISAPLAKFHWDADYECYMPDKPHLYGYDDGSGRGPDMTDKELESLQKRMDRELDRRESLITLARKFIKENDLKEVSETLHSAVVMKFIKQIHEIVGYPRPSNEPPKSQFDIPPTTQPDMWS